MTAATEDAAPGSRPRPARRALDELSLPVDRGVLDAFAAREPDWLTDDRRAAFDAWSALPAESNLLYTTYVDFRSARLEDARVVTASASSPVGGVLPDGADGLIELTEGDLTAAVLSPAASAAGVTLTTFADLLARHPERARPLVDGGGSLEPTDKFAQLTRALWSQGIVVDVPDGARLDRPIIIRSAVGAPDRALLTRTFVRVGEGASASIVEELVSLGHAATAGRQAFIAGTTELELGARSTLRMAGLQELGPDTVAFQHRTATVGEAATLHWALAQLGGRLVRSRVDNRLVGDRCSVEQVEIVFGGDEQVFDLTSYTTHVGRDTTGSLLSKGALLDRARSYMKGMIVIERSAVGTDSYLGEFGMNLSKATRSVAIPSLEIDQPDCRRAMHASSVGPIDETQLFYLESRGIPPDDARKFIVLGFLEPVVARVPLDDVQDRLRALLEAKWDAGRRARRRPRDGARGRMRRIDLLGVDEVPDGTMKMAYADGTDQVLVINSGGDFRALQGICSHEYFELDQGFLTAGTLTCALHLSRFDITDGEPLDPPAELPLAVYPVVVEDGRILIEVPDGPLEVNE